MNLSVRLGLFGVGLLLIGTACGGAQDSGAAERVDALTTTTLTCSNLTFTTGSLQSGQTLAGLATYDLTLRRDVWTKYVEFSRGANATCTYSVPADLAARAPTLSLRVNYRGPRAAQMRWLFEAWNPSTGTWVLIGDNSFAADWIWTRTTMAFPAGQYIGGGAIRIRYRATSNYDASLLDELVVLASYEAEPPDAGVDAGIPPMDAGQPDAGGADAGTPDTDPADAGSPDVESSDAGGGIPDAGGSTPDAGQPTWWKPTAGTTWDWQLEVPVNTTSANVEVYDIDMFQNDAAVVAELHRLGRKVICYVCCGSWENWRPDAALYPESVKGNPYGEGFNDERWLDIRQIDVLGPILRARFDRAKAMGCDAIEPDNIDGYDTTAHRSTGFPLTYQDQLNFNRWLANEAHARGMAIGLKNDIHQTQDLVDDFDFAVSEQCFQYGECNFFTTFIDHNKPVFECEYRLSLSKFCPQANAMNFSSIRKRNALDAYRESCR